MSVEVNEDLLPKSPEDRQKLALHDCSELIKWYEKNKARKRFFYQFSQTLTIALGAVTPVLILAEVNDVYPAITAAVAAFAASLGGTFQWREDYVRFANVAELLKIERLKFQTRTLDYTNEPKDQALDNFVKNYTDLLRTELTGWIATRSNEPDQRTSRDGTKQTKEA